MPLEPRDAAYLWDIIRHANEAAEVAAGMTYDEFLDNRHARLALERVIEIIGEGARRLSPGFRSDHSEVAWAEIIAQRNILVHQYDRLDPERIWRVATVDAPKLAATLASLVSSETGEKPNG